MNPTEMQITREMFAIQAEQKADLLAALQNLVAAIRSPVRDTISVEYLNNAEAAIAKAVGK